MLIAKIKYNKKIKCIIILLLFLLSLTGFYTVARYAQRLDVGKTGIFAKTIVLSSDLLESEAKNKTIYEKNVSFYINNFDDNKVTYNDLKYQITVKNEDDTICEDCVVKINNSVKKENVLVSSNSTQKSTDDVNIIFPRLGKYIIEAETVDTILVKINSIIDVSASEEYSYYNIVDKESYIELTIKTSNNVTNSTVFTINTSNLIPDNYNSLMEDWTTKETQMLSGLNSNSVYSLIFFKTDVANNYDKQESIINNNTISITKN